MKNLDFKKAITEVLTVIAFYFLATFNAWWASLYLIVSISIVTILYSVVALFLFNKDFKASIQLHKNPYSFWFFAAIAWSKIAILSYTGFYVLALLVTFYSYVHYYAFYKLPRLVESK